MVYTYDSNIKVEWIITKWLNDKQDLLGEACSQDSEREIIIEWQKAQLITDVRIIQF